MNTAKNTTALTFSGAINAPSVTTSVIGVLTAMQIATVLLPSSIVVDIFAALSLIPARISFLFSPDAYTLSYASGVAMGLNESDVALLLGDGGAAYWTLLTYALLHGGWAHLTLNCVSLAVFGSLLERRFGPSRFLAFLALAAIFGGLTYYFFRPSDIRPVIGASASVSAAMAANARFAFGPGGPLGEPRLASLRGADMNQPGLTTLSHMFTNRRAMGFLALWFGASLLSGIFPQAAGGCSHIAWEAHIGGFLVGLLLFNLFDPSNQKTL